MKNWRYPAEWEAQAATWLAWPHNPLNWSHRIAEIEAFYHNLILQITEFQPVCLLVPPERRVSKSFILDWKKQKFPVIIYQIPTDDIWIRDYGPFFMTNGTKVHCIKFEFNAWGQKFPPWKRDNQVPQHLARTLGLDLTSFKPILEGGAVEFNGDGVGMTTLDCLVGEQRNPENNLEALIRLIKQAFNLGELLILPRGLIGDHTDGHIDNLARFVSSRHIVVNDTSDQNSPNYEILQEAQHILRTWIDAQPETWQLSTLPLPPQRILGDEILPASYMNFIFVNDAMLIPQYNCSSDQIALDFYQKAYPQRKIVGVDCTLVIEEGGGLHCLSKQQPL
ncbi:MAG: agmatine deiminase family protein [Fibrobacter sp.]|nr:agmatine deiminase family protein [Fibrobacter sp.]